MKKIYFLLFFMIFGFISAQDKTQMSKDTIKEKRYLEDQVYTGLSYILMNKLPDSISSNGFSNSLVLGFIKDIPLNEKRNFAIGAGLGYGRHTYYQNLKITKSNNNTQFSVADNFSSNKFSMHAIELPLELRWRTSTADKYKFYRIYFGGKISYAFATNSKFKGTGTESDVKVSGVDELNKLQYGLSLSMGYGTLNVNIYYGLSDLFSNATIYDNTPIKMGDFRVGLIFYIL